MNKKISDNDDYIENHYVFEGESDSWTGEMIVDSTLQFYEKDGVLGCDSNEDRLLTVTYKGDVTSLTSVKQLKIAYDSHSSGGGMEEIYDDENPLNRKTFIISSSGGSGAIIHEDFVITVTVTIDGVTESFELINAS